MEAQLYDWPQTGEDMLKRRDVLWAGVCSVIARWVCLFVYQIADSSITAICSMPGGQVAVSSMKPAVDVLKLVWNHRHNTVR